MTNRGLKQDDDDIAHVFEHVCWGWVWLKGTDHDDVHKEWYKIGRGPRSLFIESDWWCICHDLSIHLEKNDAGCSSTLLMLTNPSCVGASMRALRHLKCWCLHSSSPIDALSVIVLPIGLCTSESSPYKGFGRQSLCGATLELGLSA